MMPQRSPGPQHIDVGHTNNPFVNQVIDFSRKGCLQAIGNMPGHLLVEANDPLSQTRIEGRCALDGVFRGLCAADDFDERYQVRRIERMRYDAALRVRFARRVRHVSLRMLRYPRAATPA